MRKLLPFLVFIFLFLIASFVLVNQPVTSEPDCDNPSFGDIDFCLEKIQNEINALSGAHENNKEEYSDLQAQITSLKRQIAGVSNQLVEVEAEIEQREADLAYAQKIFNEKASNHYRFIRTYDPLMPFLSSKEASEAFREIVIRQKAADSDRVTMEKLASELQQLQKDKAKLEQNRASLASVQAQVDERAQFLEGEIEKVEGYLTELSAKQQELAALKAGGFQTSIGDTPPTLEPCSGPPGTSNFCDPGFRPAFAFFSFGAPHRAGMSQYGAYGRSKSGQSVETILSAYYQGATLNKSYQVPATIGVDGYGTVPFEDNYLLGIYEVPESWGDNGGFEALKAQAVAARSYALAVTNNGTGSICTDEGCQVYKPQLKSGKWAEAVRATRGWVLTKDGSPAKTYYASTSGGFTLTKWGWSGIKDTSGSWPDTAFEKIAGSPWFYKGWYKTRGGSTCGRSGPWLTSEEMADIINAWEVLHNNAGGDAGRIWPIDCLGEGKNPYSISELASIGGHKSVSSISVVYGNDGNTATVRVTTNKGSFNIPGWQLSDPKNGAANLRAPGYIGIKSGLYNIEKL